MHFILTVLLLTTNNFGVTTILLLNSFIDAVRAIILLSIEFESRNMRMTFKCHWRSLTVLPMALCHAHYKAKTYFVAVSSQLRDFIFYRSR